jgi:selenocysteine-specific elongation factor
MIVATAGHVDHGKTSLIKALTGTDTDRLAEEKKRGLTIDLGFAYLPIGEGAGAPPIGFIDVPGHERFIRNMVCGVAGTDLALFIVAADDGIMPQTREHLAILDLLGVRRGIVALTKVDRVDADRIAAVSEEIEAVLAETSLAQAPILAVSSVTGEGVDTLREALLVEARGEEDGAPGGNFRLAVDRRFDVTGTGLVVTGTAFSGVCRVGDQVHLQGGDESWRVRGIRAQSRDAQAASAGQRVALNLTGPGLAREAVKRGDWIVAGDLPPPSRKIDVRLIILASEAAAFSHWTPVHVHLGAAETTGRVALLDSKVVAPGERSLAQLVLDNPLGTVAGDGFIIRDQSARRTIGGGRVIDVLPPRRGRAHPDRLVQLAAQETPNDEVALAEFAKISANGVDVRRFAQCRNLTSEECDRLTAAFEGRLIANEGGPRAFSHAAWHAVGERTTAALEAWHEAHPDKTGPGDEPLLAAAGLRSLFPIAKAVTAELETDGVLVRERLGLRRPGHRPALKGADDAAWQKIAAIIQSSGLRPATVGDIAEQSGLSGRRLEALLQTAGRHGLVHRVSKTRYLTQPMLDELAEIARATAEQSTDGTFDARAFRDASGIGRNMTIEVLEYFDRLGLTVRRGDKRVIRPAAPPAQSSRNAR